MPSGGKDAEELTDSFMKEPSPSSHGPVASYTPNFHDSEKLNDRRLRIRIARLDVDCCFVGPFLEVNHHEGFIPHSLKRRRNARLSGAMDLNRAGKRSSSNFILCSHTWLIRE